MPKVLDLVINDSKINVVAYDELRNYPNDSDFYLK